MELSQVINGYIYAIPDTDKRKLLFEQLAILVDYSKDGTFISTDTTYYPELWDNAINQAEQVYNAMMTIMGECSDLLTMEMNMLLSPPGNIFPPQEERTASSIIFKNTGALWNIWAAYTLYNSDSAEAVNNEWNTKYATQGFMPTQPDVNGNYYPANDHISDQNNDMDYRLPLDLDKDSDEFKNFLVQAIYDFRNLSDSELEAAVESLTGNINSYPALEILKNPSIQDMLYSDYAITGEGQLQRELGIAADQMRLSEDVLTALNLISKMTAVDVEVDRYLRPVSGAENTLWDCRDYLVSGYSMLKSLYHGGQITDEDRLDAIQSILALGYSAFSECKNNTSNGIEALVLWWAGPDPENTNSSYGQYSNIYGSGTHTTNQSTTANNNAIAQWQNLNDSLQQDLKEAVFIYQEFVKSASSIMKKLHQTLTTVAQDIRSR